MKVTYLGIRSAHERVWLVEGKPIWLPRAYLTRGDLEPARGNVHVCKLVRELMNIQILTVTAERDECSKCIFPTNAIQLYEASKEGRKERTRRRERRKEGRRTREKARVGVPIERGKTYRMCGADAPLGGCIRSVTATERGRKRSTQHALKPTIVVSVGLIQESVSYCFLRPLWTTSSHVVRFLTHIASP